MLPYLTIFNYTFHVGSSLLLISVLITFIIIYRNFHKKIGFIKINLLVLLTSAGAFTGARLFHVVFERFDYFKNNPGEIFADFKGMTFYGALFSGIITLSLLNKLLIRDKLVRARLWDFGSICLAMTYGFMRIGCFASGCCWGRISPLPWSVQYYHPKSAMPVKGIPVHPVQLYDSLLGFLIMFLLISLNKSRMLKEGNLIWFFIFFYTIGRFITETFRGDAFRGDSIILGLSTSQVISVSLLFIMFATNWRSIAGTLKKG